MVSTKSLSTPGPENWSGEVGERSTTGARLHTAGQPAVSPRALRGSRDADRAHSGPGGGRPLAPRRSRAGEGAGVRPEDLVVHMIKGQPYRAEHDALVPQRGRQHLRRADDLPVQLPAQ